jgi:MazG family protein
MNDRTAEAAGTARLIEIMAALRTPETGCPWDLEQTFATIAPYTIEEAYEVAEAIREGDTSALKDELGDLLFQVVYHARMAEEAGAFAYADVVQAISDKMVRRHPHVFGNMEIASADAQSVAWEEQKAAERANGTAAKSGTLDDVPLALPALTRAEKLQKRASRVGFDWPHVGHVLDKIGEEVAELRAEIESGGGTDRLADELGDILFGYANVARHLGVDSEEALRRCNAKFMRRFRHIESALAGEGRAPERASLAEMESLWQAAKKAEAA